MPTITKKTEYRAKCATAGCGKTYSWTTEEGAEDDADRHQRSSPTHKVNIEKKTTDHTFRRR